MCLKIVFRIFVAWKCNSTDVFLIKMNTQEDQSSSNLISAEDIPTISSQIEKLDNDHQFVTSLTPYFYDDEQENQVFVSDVLDVGFCEDDDTDSTTIPENEIHEHQQEIDDHILLELSDEFKCIEADDDGNCLGLAV